MLIDWFTVAAQAVNFLILVWVLHRFAFRPILKAAAEREERIAKRLAEADQSREKAEEQRRLAEQTNLELANIRNTALAEAEAEARRRLKKALQKVDGQAEQLRRQWERTLERRSEELARDIRSLVSRQAVDISRRAVLDMAGRTLEDLLADSLVRNMDIVRRELAPAGTGGQGGRVEIRAPRELGDEAAEHLRDALAQAFPEAEIALSRNGHGPGLVLAAGGRRLEWTLERYFKGLEEDIKTVLQTHRRPQ